MDSGPAVFSAAGPLSFQSGCLLLVEKPLPDLVVGERPLGSGRIGHLFGKPRAGIDLDPETWTTK